MNYDLEKISYLLQSEYSLLVKFVKKIDQGVLNSNYLVEDFGKKKYIFKIYNYKNLEQVTFEIDILNYLSLKNFSSPILKPTNFGSLVTNLDNKVAVLYYYIEGEIIDDVTNDILEAVGKKIGLLHNLLIDFKPRIIKKTWEPESLKGMISDGCREIYQRGFPDAQNLENFIRRELNKYTFPSKLVKGITHQDIKLENVIFKNGEIVGVIDFDNAYLGTLLHDFMTTAIWTCFSKSHLNTFRIQSLLKGYESQRRLTELEKKFFWDSLKCRLVREVFIGPLVTYNFPEITKKRADYFIKIYNNLNTDEYIDIFSYEK